MKLSLPSAFLGKIWKNWRDFLCQLVAWKTQENYLIKDNLLQVLPLRLFWPKKAEGLTNEVALLEIIVVIGSLTPCTFGPKGLIYEIQ